MGSLNKKQIIFIIAIGVLVVGVIGTYIYSIYQQNQIEEDAIFYEEEIEQEENRKEEEKVEKIVVHIAGEVNNPGIVEVNLGSRIADVVEEAGGFTQEANWDKVNLAYIVEDGQKITIPNQEEVGNDWYISKESGNNILEETKSESGEKMDMVNINEATQTQLEELPGIGPSTALKIVEHRKENGNFKTVEEIKNVSGIGEAKYEKIKDSICVK